ncbi:DegT/DnrJ/EryC1/StrS family aminotransferase [Actinosynnema sp. NPDC050436]|uniref:DegT/DnrJ/EryC1/StrS family aminotransferase n=1 Tax=Actinosynnema sp. NPDC050436 TaxID=3155659 RepID=UPI0033EE5BBF
MAHGMINVFQPDLGEQELAAIAEVFAGRWLGYGPRTRRFEAEFAERIGVPPDRVLFLNSATAGLFLACELLDLMPGDEVVMPSQGFVANANSVVAVGARPVFCDVDPRTLNPTVAHVEAALTPRTRAVVVLHYGGYPGEVAAIAELCRSRGVALIEDAACSISSTVDGKACGTFGDIAMWSFDSRKIMTTGDGGVLYTRDPERARRAHRLAYHGLEDRSAFTTAGKGAAQWWELHISEVGRRVIGNDMTAAIGSVQLARLPAFLRRRAEIADLYTRLLADVGGVRTPPPLPPGHTTSNYFYWVQFAGGIRDAVAQHLLERGIYTTFRYSPLHAVPVFGWEGTLPGTEEAARTTLILPGHHGLSDDDVHLVADELRTVVESHLVRT